MRGLLIIGAGGHGKVVANSAEAQGAWNKLAFVDDRYPDPADVLGIPVIGQLEVMSSMQNEFADAVVALGDNYLRHELTEKLKALGFNLPVIRHPSSVVSDSVEIGYGTVIFANTVVESNVDIGSAVILNSSSSVAQDCRIGSGVHLAPGVNVGAKVKIGECAFLGVGASVQSGVDIGRNTIIGAGSSVTENIEDHIVAAGVPTRKIRTND